MGRGLPIGLGGLIVLALLSWATGTDFLSLLGPAVQQGAPADTADGPRPKLTRRGEAEVARRCGDDGPERAVGKAPPRAGIGRRRWCCFAIR